MHLGVGAVKLALKGAWTNEMGFDEVLEKFQEVGRPWNWIPEQNQRFRPRRLLLCCKTFENT